MKKRALMITLFTIVATITALFTVTTFNNKMFPLLINAGENPFIQLNSNDVPSEADVTPSTFNHSYSDYVTIRYENAYLHYDNDALIGLKQWGSISKIEESRGLSSFVISFTGTIYFESTYENETDSYYRLYPNSGVEYPAYGNYWKIVAFTDDVKIISININYDCNVSSSLPMTGEAIVSNYKRSSGIFVNFEQRDNSDVYFSFSAYTDKNYNQSKLLPSDIVLGDESTINASKTTITADYIEYRSSSEFEAYFCLSDWLDNRLDTTSLSITNFHAHLFIRGVACQVYNSDGDLRINNNENATVTTGDFYDANGHYSVSLPTWGKMPIISISPNFEIISKDGEIIQESSYENSDDLFVLNMVTNKGSITRMYKESFVLSDSDTNPTSNAIVAKEIQIGEAYQGYGYKMKIIFSTLDFHNLWKAKGSPNELNYWCHLFINGKPYSGTNGNLKTSEVVNSPDGHDSNWAWKSYNWITSPDDNSSYNIWYAWDVIIIQVVPR